MKLPRYAMTVILLGLAAGVLGCSGGSKDGGESREIVARIGPSTITREDLERRIQELPPSQKKRFDTDEGRSEYVDKLIEEELLYLAARKSGYHRKPDVRAKIDASTRAILVGEYYQGEVYANAVPGEAELEQYYEENIDEFTKKPLMRARHILFKEDREKAEETRARAIKNPSEFAEIARSVSEDEATRAEGGDLGYFNPGGYIRSIGFSRQFTDAVFELDEGEISDVIEHEKGYSIVMVLEKVEAQVLPLPDVKKRIIDKLKGPYAQKKFKEHIEGLKKQFHSENLYAIRLSQETMSPEEYWNKATMSEDSYDRIQLYRELLDKYPDSDYAPEAQFMIGFVYSEELQDLVEARRAYELVLQNYPDDEMADQARWMIENLNKPLPNFQNPDDVETMMNQEGE